MQSTPNTELVTNAKSKMHTFLNNFISRSRNYTTSNSMILFKANQTLKSS